MWENTMNCQVELHCFLSTDSDFSSFIFKISWKSTRQIANKIWISKDWKKKLVRFIFCCYATQHYLPFGNFHLFRSGNLIIVQWFKCSIIFLANLLYTNWLDSLIFGRLWARWFNLKLIFSGWSWISQHFEIVSILLLKFCSEHSQCQSRTGELIILLASFDAKCLVSFDHIVLRCRVSSVD